jgi:CubicO group peptidase (beta-lactamase class C family)
MRFSTAIFRPASYDLRFKLYKVSAKLRVVDYITLPFANFGPHMKNSFRYILQARFLALLDTHWLMPLLLLLVMTSCKENTAQSQPVKLKPRAKFTSADSTRWKFQRKMFEDYCGKFDTNKFNGCIALIDRGHVIYQYCSGYVNRKTKEKIDTCALFQLASVSKPFTAMAILQLQQAGKLSIYDTVAHYLPEYPYKNVLIEHLLRHTSGMWCHINEPWAYNRYFPKKEYFDNLALLQLLAKHKVPLGAKPGVRFHYCNTGYAMLALLVERVSGKRFEDYMDQHIFKPAGMRSSFISRTNQPEAPSGIVNPYRAKYHGTAHYYKFHDGVVGDKGLYTTLADLARFDDALYRGKIVSKDLLEASYQIGYGQKQTPIRYGWGWRIQYIGNKEPYVYHQGFWNTFNPSFIRYVNQERTLLILHNNSADIRSSKIIRHLSGILLDDSIGIRDPNCEAHPKYDIDIMTYPGN